MNTPLLRRIGLILLLSLPVILFTFKFSIIDRNGIMINDWLYFSQSYEAARMSILEFHQFPWWNAWALGGVPLYANPQFGLISIQMPLVLLFGTLPGLHIAVMVYLILGFWGMFLLLRHWGARKETVKLLGLLKLREKSVQDIAIPALLSYIWVFSSFPILHLYAGHLTFATYLLVPWFLLALLRIRHRRGWLWFGLITALLINQAAHYITIQLLVIGGLVALYQLFQAFRHNKRHKLTIYEILKPYLFACALIIPLVVHKLYYTAKFLGEFPRITPEDDPTPFNVFIASLTSGGLVDSQTMFKVPFGWHEYGVYFGVVTLGLFVFAVIAALRKFKKLEVKYYALLLFIVITAMLSFGAFAWFAPYTLLHNLPVFEQMRVPSRWLGWTVVGVILFLARLPRNKIVYALLAISCIDLFAANYAVLNVPQKTYIPPTRKEQTFEQYSYYESKQSVDARLFESTQLNKGELFGYEPIVNFYPDHNPDVYGKLTDHCGVNQGCPFVQTRNAKVVSWSPQRIVLERTGPGEINLNMNPGGKWFANGKELFMGYRLFELKKQFIIRDTAQTIIVEWRP